MSTLVNLEVHELNNFEVLCCNRKEAGLSCGSFLRKGEVFAYVGRNQTLKDLVLGGRTLQARVTLFWPMTDHRGNREFSISGYHRPLLGNQPCPVTVPGLEPRPPSPKKATLSPDENTGTFA